MFPRKNIHKETWNSPNGMTKNQIDHVLIDTRYRKNITNVRSLRGAECGSDHNLVLVEIFQRLALEKRDKQKQKPLVDYEKLKDPIIASNFRTNFLNKYENNNNEDCEDIETK